MTKTLAVVNLKGGVGKTTIAVNFAAYCGMQGKRTLLVDLDPQTNATFSCISSEVWQQHAKDNGTVADLLGAKTHASAEGRQRTAEDVILPGVFPGVDLIPSHLDLFTVDLDLGGATAREKLLKRSLASVMSNYDVVICDCPPNLTIPTQNALALSSHYVVPVSPDFLSALGIGLLTNRVRRFCRDLEHDLTFSGVILSKVGRDSAHREEIKDTIRRQFTGNVFNTEIKERSAVSESASQGRPVFQMADQKAVDEFEAVSRQLMLRMGI